MQCPIGKDNNVIIVTACMLRIAYFKERYPPFDVLGT